MRVINNKINKISYTYTIKLIKITFKINIKIYRTKNIQNIIFKIIIWDIEVG